MQWQVTGADTQTGKDRTVIVDATDEPQAIRRGNREGLMAEKANPLNGSADSAPDPLDDLASEWASEDSAKAQPVTAPTIGPRKYLVRNTEIEMRFAGTLPGKPKKLLPTASRTEYVAVQRLKLVLDDPDTGEISKQLVDLPMTATFPDVIAASELQWGCNVRKIVVLNKFWQETEKESLLESVLTIGAIVALFG